MDLLVMSNYWGKQIFTHGSFPEVGQSTRRRKEKKKRERERAKVGNNDDKLRIATPPRLLHAKPPGPKIKLIRHLKQVVLCC